MWNGAAWAALGAGLDAIVYDMTFVANGDLIVVGNFDFVPAGIAVDKIARWTPATATWAAIGAGCNGIPYAIERLLASNIVYMAGAQTIVDGGVTVNGINKLDTSTDTYTALEGGVAGGSPHSIAIDKNINLHIRGDFTTVDGITCTGYGK